MRFISILVGTLVLVGALTTRRADACGSGGPGGGAVAAIVVLGGAYVGGTIAFGVKDIAGSEHSVAYGTGEMLFNAPFAIAWGKALYDEANSPYRDSEAIKAEAVFFGIHTALLAHGIYTMAKPRRPKDTKPQRYDGPPGMFQAGPVTAVVSPAPISNGGGVGISGTF